MDDSRINDAKKKLAEINKAIAALDPSIRLAAFEILAPIYFEDREPSDGKKPKTPKTDKSHGRGSSPTDPDKFFNEHDHKRPKDNVHLVAAWFYSQYGVTPISKKDLRECADGAGLTVPERPDNTMRSAKKDGKNLYRQKGGGWQLTVKGEAYLREAYGVKKGNKTRPIGDDE